VLLSCFFRFAFVLLSLLSVSLFGFCFLRLAFDRRSLLSFSPFGFRFAFVAFVLLSFCLRSAFDLLSVCFCFHRSAIVWLPFGFLSAGGLLPSGNRSLCTPTCISLASKMQKQIRQPEPGAPLFGAIAPYKFHNLGLKACNNKLVGEINNDNKHAYAGIQ
jgi:hypothetical protein